jgi:hypothetical protein
LLLHPGDAALGLSFGHKVPDDNPLGQKTTPRIIPEIPRIPKKLITNEVATFTTLL